MISPLHIATDGYLSETNKTLSVAVNGYLHYTEIVINRPKQGIFGGAGSYIDRPKKLEFIQQDDREVFIIIQTFLRLQ